MADPVPAIPAEATIPADAAVPAATPQLDAPGSDSAGGAPGSGTPAGDTDQFQSIRDAAGGFDYDLSSYDSDEEALRHLVDRSRQ